MMSLKCIQSAATVKIGLSRRGINICYQCIIKGGKPRYFSSLHHHYLSTKPQARDVGDSYREHFRNSPIDKLEQQQVSDEVLSLHPAFVPDTGLSRPFKYPQQDLVTPSLPLQNFIDLVPGAIQARQDLLAKEKSHSTTQNQAADDPVMALFRTLNLQPSDWAPYAHFDDSKAYTRNLIATDDLSYALLLLCWNPGRESKIHDHPCDGCWLTVLQGQIQETRYEYPSNDNNPLVCVADDIFSQGQVAFIDDSIGLHKVGNPSDHVPAATLHLYSPPFGKCKVWARDDDGGGVMTGCVSHSVYGRVL